ncbi:MAG TPA: cytochrome c [Chitinophagaceae bacterium]|nr:cytochrome c [Chitinophagaceae bacterium]
MKLRMLITIVICAGFATCAIRKSEPITQKAFVPGNQRVANGEKVFMMHCQKCHPGGESGLGPAINPNPAPQFIKRFQVRHGLGVMPSFKQNEISKRDLKDISKYLKAWKNY